MQTNCRDRKGVEVWKCTLDRKKKRLTLNAPVTIAADDSLDFFHCFSEKVSLEIPCGSSARQSLIFCKK